MPCRVRLGPTTFSGMVLDLSRTGLFVQTSASARSGERVEVHLGQQQRRIVFTVAAEVVWRRKVPPQLISVAEGGLGLKIQAAPEEYFALLAEIAKLPGAA